MKHTIKANAGRIGVDSFPQTGEVVLGIRDWNGAYVGLTLTPDTLGAVIFALEQAGEELETAAQRLRCAGDGLCSVPAVACETPKACGVAP